MGTRSTREAGTLYTVVHAEELSNLYTANWIHRGLRLQEIFFISDVVYFWQPVITYGSDSNSTQQFSNHPVLSPDSVEKMV